MSEQTYIDAHPEAFIFPDPVFAGNVDGGLIPPAAVTGGMDAAANSYAIHINGTTSNFIVLVQDSLEMDGSTYNWLDQSIQFMFEDTIQTGTYSVDIYSGLEIDVYGVDPSIVGDDKSCLKAFGFLGNVTFNSVSNLTDPDGGAFNVTGGPLYLYHPTALPIYGDISDQITTPICPM